MRVLNVILLGLFMLSACSQAGARDPLIPKLEELAEHGSGEAMYHLGMAYWTGTGATKDQSKAADYFRRAAASGDPLGAYKLGCVYDGQDGVFDRDSTAALKYKLVAAKAGYALAQQDVAALYAQKGDFATAIQWLEKAARQGTSGALMTYASVYNGAPGIKPDPVKTAAYFRLYVDRADANDEQRTWLQSFEKKLSIEQRAQAARLVADYRPAPSPLTLKALNGVESAKALIAAH